MILFLVLFLTIINKILETDIGNPTRYGGTVGWIMSRGALNISKPITWISQSSNAFVQLSLVSGLRNAYRCENLKKKTHWFDQIMSG